MPTSSATCTKRSFAPAAKLLVALVFLTLVNAAMSFAFEPYGSKSQLVWTDYTAQEQLDTVVVGSSVMQHALNPDVFDEAAGAVSYNMSTPMQTLIESFVGIRTAYEDHGITRAVLSLTPEVMNWTTDRPNPGSVFLTQRAKVVGPLEAAKTWSYVTFDKGGVTGPNSLNCFLPWVSNHTPAKPNRVLKNIKMKLDGTSMYKASEVNEPGWIYRGRGCGNRDSVLDYDSDEARTNFDRADISKVNVRSEAMLREIAAWCQERGIDLVAVGVPMPVYDVLGRFDQYCKLQDRIAAICSDAGVDYYDFNLVRPELMQIPPESFCDYAHLGNQGSIAFSQALGRLLVERDKGEDVRALFFSPDEYRASIGYISAVFVDVGSQADGVHVHARAFAGSQVKVSYQLCEKDGDGWREVATWQDSPDFVYAPASHGTCKLRVNVRVAGSSEPFEHYREFTAVY